MEPWRRLSNARTRAARRTTGRGRRGAGAGAEDESARRREGGAWVWVGGEVERGGNTESNTLKTGLSVIDDLLICPDLPTKLLYKRQTSSTPMPMPPILRPCGFSSERQTFHPQSSRILEPPSLLETSFFQVHHRCPVRPPGAAPAAPGSAR